MTEENGPAMLTGETCPACLKKTLTLIDDEKEIPYFGKVYLFSMDCSNEECNLHQADIELAENHGPVKYEFEVSSEEDMSVRVIKSAGATLKIPRIMTIEPGPASNGYVTNIEGILNRAKTMLEKTRDSSDDKSDVKKCKNMIKKLQNIMWGRDSIKITLDDPTGNSAIISDKAVVKKGKK